MGRAEGHGARILGALITMSVTAIVNAIYQRDFAREFVESLRVRRLDPLGEVELARLRAQPAQVATDR